MLTPAPITAASPRDAGLSAATVLLPGEDEAYRTMCERMFARFAPASTSDKEFVQQLCDTRWRLRCCKRLEAAHVKAADLLRKNEAHLKRRYSILKQALTVTLADPVLRESRCRRTSGPLDSRL